MVIFLAANRAKPLGLLIWLRTLAKSGDSASLSAFYTKLCIMQI